MKNQHLYTLLAFAGATPFAACAALQLAGISTVVLLGPLDRLAGSYGLAILSFIAGTHWAFQLLREEETPYNLFIASNIVFLAVWITWVVVPLGWALSVQAVAFAFLLYVDRDLSARDITSSHYLRARSIATAVAIVSLLTLVVTQ